MERGTQPVRKPSKRRRREFSSFHDILAQLRHSGSVYVVESLPKAAIHTLKTRKTATLSLPAQFVRENGGKTIQSVILRAHSPRGRPARPFLVQLRVSARSHGSGKIRIGGRLYAAIARNLLREGDSLVFVPRKDAILEFEVYTFRGTWETFPLFPDEGDSASPDEGKKNNNDNDNNIQFSLASPSHHQGNCKAMALPNTKHLEPHPAFYKQLQASHIGRADRHLLGNSGYFEFPNSFMKTHGKHVRASVKLQGIHQDSPTRVIACRRSCTKQRSRVYLQVSEWYKFVTDNGLQKGHRLQFSLVADSSFVVRKV